MPVTNQILRARLVFRLRVIDELRQKNADLAEQLAQFGIKPRARRVGPVTFAEAEIRARQVYALRRKHWTHARIAAHLGISRCLVTHYLSPECKSARRAGLR